MWVVPWVGVTGVPTAETLVASTAVALAEVSVGATAVRSVV